MKEKVRISQTENDRFFNQKLPTFRWGFCVIERAVTGQTEDPENEGCIIGQMKTPKGLVKVSKCHGSNYGWEVA